MIVGLLFPNNFRNRLLTSVILCHMSVMWSGTSCRQMLEIYWQFGSNSFKLLQQISINCICIKYFAELADIIWWDIGYRNRTRLITSKWQIMLDFYHKFGHQTLLIDYPSRLLLAFSKIKSYMEKICSIIYFRLICALEIIHFPVVLWLLLYFISISVLKKLKNVMHMNYL